MRTQPRDQGGTITFSATVTDASGGSGVAQPGAIPFTFTRPQAGEYIVRFDTRLTPLSANATAVIAGTRTVTVIQTQPGMLDLLRVVPSTGAFESGNLMFSCTASDKR